MVVLSRSMKPDHKSLALNTGVTCKKPIIISVVGFLLPSSVIILNRGIVYAMQVYKVGIPEIAIGPLASKLKSSLSIGPTVWFIPGGSNIKLAVAVMARLGEEISGDLTIALTDERYGAYNHPDSNWYQLLKSGFDPKSALVIETLKPDNAPMDVTVQRFTAEVESALEASTDAIGQFGMGTDGHIAGILPNSPASNDIDQLIIGYDSDPFKRITLSFNGIRRLSSAFMVAVGQEKQDQLDKLVNQNLPLNIQPAQIIKQVEESYLYNDLVEGKK